MKFTQNGALTISVRSMARMIEIREGVGAEDFFLFGLTEKEVGRIQREGYNPSANIEKNPQLSEIIHLIASGHFSHGDTHVFGPLLDNLCRHDPFQVLADYVASQVNTGHARCSLRLARANPTFQGHMA